MNQQVELDSELQTLNSVLRVAIRNLATSYLESFSVTDMCTFVQETNQIWNCSLFGYPVMPRRRKFNGSNHLLDHEEAKTRPLGTTTVTALFSICSLSVCFRNRDTPHNPVIPRMALKGKLKAPIPSETMSPPQCCYHWHMGDRRATLNGSVKHSHIKTAPTLSARSWSLSSLFPPERVARHVYHSLRLSLLRSPSGLRPRQSP